MRFILSALLFLFPFFVSARDVPINYGPWQSPIEGRCQAFAESPSYQKYLPLDPHIGGFFNESHYCFPESSPVAEPTRVPRPFSCPPGFEILDKSRGGPVCRNSEPPPPNPCKLKADNGETLTGTYVEGAKGSLTNWPDISPRCANGCSVGVAATAPMKCFQYVQNGVTMIACSKTFIHTGMQCTASDKPLPSSIPSDTPPPTSCDPVKQDKITLNGKDICVNKSTGKEINPTTGEDADGDKKTDKDIKKDKTPDNKDRTTEIERTKNPDGSVTEKKTETICDSAGNCNTKVSEKTTGRGDSESHPPSDGPDNDICKKYPNKKICAEKGTYSDSGCPGIPACDGDAIQCGIAIEVKRRNCKDEKELQDARQQLESSPEKARYDQDKGRDSNAPGAAWGSGSGAGGTDTINIADKFNPDAFKAGACNLQDIVFSLGAAPGGGGAGSFTIPVSQWCTYMPAISACVLISAAIVSMLIIYNGITRTA